MLQRHNAFDLTALNAAFSDLAMQARAWLTAEGIAQGVQRLERFADLRYAHQGYELTVPVPDGLLTETTLAQLLATFQQEHQRLYTYASPELPVELVNLRVSASGPAQPLRFQPLPSANGTPLSPPETRAVYFPTAGGFVECAVYDYTALPSGASITGPAIITQDLSTIVVQPQHQVHLDSYGNIIMTIPQYT
jgi:N-methylhydantoinase A